jgi:hypothetical protein
MMRGMDRYVQQAVAERLRRVRIEQIQAETARVWAGRAIAAYRQAMVDNCVGPLLDAEAYADEAYEHSALAGDFGLMAEIRAAILPIRDAARKRWGLRPQ